MEFNHVSGFSKKYHDATSLKKRYTLCLWSDLLGFGTPLMKNQWQLSPEEEHRISERLSNAHKRFLSSTSPYGEANIILNDGLAKASTMTIEDHPDMFGFFFRNCVTTHLGINEVERIDSFPGARSILSFGASIEYMHQEFVLDDYVFSYTKADPNQLSKIARLRGNPTIVYNPVPFQMNMAFAKSYVLDSLGSEYGIKGNRFYFDESVLLFFKMLADTHDIHMEETKNNGKNRVLLHKGDDYVHFGFEYSSGIEIEYNYWSTKVFVVEKFYPPDEKVTEFHYDL